MAVITVKEPFISKIKRVSKEKFKKTKEWCGEHKAEIIVYGPMIGSTILELSKALIKRNNLREERRLKEEYSFDPHTHIRYELKRGLTNKEKLEIEVREENGEKRGAILQSMNVLK